MSTYSFSELQAFSQSLAFRNILEASKSCSLESLTRHDILQKALDSFLDRNFVETFRLFGISKV